MQIATHIGNSLVDAAILLSGEDTTRQAVSLLRAANSMYPDSLQTQWEYLDTFRGASADLAREMFGVCVSIYFEEKHRKLYERKNDGT